MIPWSNVLRVLQGQILSNKYEFDMVKSRQRERERSASYLRCSTFDWQPGSFDFSKKNVA